MNSEQIQRYAELPLELESELGRCVLPVREVLALAPGSILKLPASFGSNVQLFAGGAPFAAGEWIRSDGVPAIRLLTFGSGKAA
ncbi:MAG TPA: FliM/FliN family flagellar motor C-terminal domain-containing protein [Bryobacteraceae bacterium]|nr:FliM/FliN family flagellar motor C-terminal domain-containing protein [Bryobacteraceae bacterium]